MRITKYISRAIERINYFLDHIFHYRRSPLSEDQEQTVKSSFGYYISKYFTPSFDSQGMTLRRTKLGLERIWQ